MKDVARIDDWAGDGGLRWLAQLDLFEKTNAPVGEALLAQAAYRPGEHVLDVGCGGGATSRAIARQVAPGGSVLAIDISAALVEEARRRAVAEAVPGLQFQLADAATAQLPQAPFDRLHSRFGIMFFAGPAAAFAHLATLLRAGGRADFAVWAPAAANPWMSAPAAIVRRHAGLPAPDPRAPGPFSLGDRDYFRGLLEAGGFRDVVFHDWHGQQWIGAPGASAAEALAFTTGSMAIGKTIRELEPAVRTRVEAELLALYEAHRGTQGVALPAHALLVSAGVR